ncbi:hypothetical protein CUJ86_10655 [Methanofollis fontis]|uniref:Uncharacterized protein n=1 Tax=Methanofollis fontis TaxID=2052832 RepID=A0A483CSK3_9EURY|nr:hypothetical protein CUJ86_10655 [Methanofollis fontis]
MIILVSLAVSVRVERLLIWALKRMPMVYAEAILSVWLLEIIEAWLRIAMQRALPPQLKVMPAVLLV